MTRTFEWQGHKLDMRIFFTPRLLMLATDTTLSVDGKLVGRKCGWGITETAVGSFSHNGKAVRSELQVRGNRSVFTKVPYELRLDGVRVSEGKLNIERIAPAVVVWLSIVSLLILLAVAA